MCHYGFLDSYIEKEHIYIHLILLFIYQNKWLKKRNLSPVMVTRLRLT